MNLLPIAQLKVLVALRDMQPCTVNVIQIYLGYSQQWSNEALPRLCEAGLVQRKKNKPTFGKPPYMYSLTPQGEAVAIHLHRAALALKAARRLAS